MPRHPNDVNEFNDKNITSPTALHANGLANGNAMDTKKSWSQTLITADGSRVKKKYKKSTLNNTNSNNIINGNGIATNGPNSNRNSQMNSAQGTVCNGIRKERSLHYCSICSKGFKDKYSVNVHIRTHTGEKVSSWRNFVVMQGVCNLGFEKLFKTFSIWNFLKFFALMRVEYLQYKFILWVFHPLGFNLSCLPLQLTLFNYNLANKQIYMFINLSIFQII